MPTTEFKSALSRLLLVAAVAGLAAVLPAEPMSRAATAIEVVPAVMRYPVDGPRRPLEVGRALFAGDRVTTDESGRLKLILADGSDFALMHNSDLTLKAVGDHGAGGSVFRLLLGILQGAVRHMGPGQTLYIETPTGVAGVKGTEYQVEVSSDHTELKVLNGVVELSDPAGHGRISVGPGMAAESYADHVGSLRKMNRDEVVELRRSFLVKVRQAKEDYLRRVKSAQDRP